MIKGWFLLGVLAAGCGGEVMNGSGQRKTETRPVAGFRQISMEIPATVDIQQTGKEELTIEGDDNLLPVIHTDVHSGHLKVSTRASVQLRPAKPIVVHIQVIDLERVSLAGAGELTIGKLSAQQLTVESAGAGNIEALQLALGSLDVSLNGSGKLTAAGKAPQLKVNLTGSGGFDGEKLQSTRATLGLVGSGDAKVWVAQQLTANLTGSGSVHYLGSPTIQKNVVGSATVAPLKP